MTQVEIITSREVPLGGPRAIKVHRTLPHKQRSLIGAWCFADHYGPERSTMDVAPHPHTGLQTASWLFSGEIQHYDAGGNQGLIHPGELYLMTSGNGISHTETTTANTDILHGVQLWIALPDATRKTASRDLQYFKPPRTPVPGGQLKVFLGTLGGAESPVETHTPLLGAELTIDAHAEVTLGVDPAFEHGVLADAGRIFLEDHPVAVTELAYTAPGAGTLRIRNEADAPGRVLILGGEPFEEQILMWWNFVARTHEEIVEFHKTWNLSHGKDADGQFGDVPKYVGHGGLNEEGRGTNPEGLTWLPAPPLPHGRLRPRPR